LTHLVLHLNHNARDPHVFLTSTFSLPNLTDLVLADLCVYPPPYSPETFGWPALPSLRRLTFLNHGHFHDFAFPSASNVSNLRVLEIVGGVYHVDHFWTHLLPLAPQLESLVLVPVYLACIPPGNDLSAFSNLHDVRISLVCFYPSMVANIDISPPTLEMPSTLRQITITNEPYLCQSRSAVMRSARDQVERILLEKKISHCYEDLKHIDVVLAVDTQHRVDIEDLKVAAKSMGVSLDIRLRCALDLFRDSA
jgi:hypothetical protein